MSNRQTQLQTLDWKKIQAAYDKGMSCHKLCKCFPVAMATLFKAKDKGWFKTRTKSESCKMRISSLTPTERKLLTSRLNPKGGYRANAGRSKKYKVYDSYGNLVTLQSSFELKCSDILNDLNIKWVRPKALIYDGKKYFADFYLPELNIWLDPKNNYKAKLDAEKIAKVKQQNNIKLYVVLEHQLTKNFIGSLAETD